ncbi:hypothetical protein Btru_016187 [Bulinus truncatus]|nr:hypothetical protein Btru_016187 [Bulinus truncatus]
MKLVYPPSWECVDREMRLVYPPSWECVDREMRLVYPPSWECVDREMRLVYPPSWECVDREMRLVYPPSWECVDRVGWSLNGIAIFFSKLQNSVAAIEANSFVPSSFKSSTTTKVKEEELNLSSHDDAIFGSLTVTGFTIKPDPDTKPIQLDPDSIIHPSLFCSPEEKMERWIQRLSQMRRRKLEGEAIASH